jgi:thioredoxin 1
MLRKLLGALGGQPAKAPPSAPENRPLRPAPLPVGDREFDDLVAATGALVAVDFWADWCEPCQVMSAHVDFLAQDFAGRLLVLAMDVDENPDVPARFHVMGLPTLLFLQNGKEVDRIVGIDAYESLKRRVAGLLPADPLSSL